MTVEDFGRQNPAHLFYHVLHQKSKGMKMQYPKPVMKISELQEMGFTKDWLMFVFRQRNQTIAWKITPAKNSAILFDTEALEKYRKAHCG